MSFAYTTLAPFSIRLLRIDTIEPLACTVTHHVLASAPPYAALSYCWGSSPPSRDVHINGKTLTITKSLHKALEAAGRFLSDPCDTDETKRNLAIWADAICINQRDDAEKAVQIPLMGELYKKAERVLVWMGVEGEGSEVVMAVMRWWEENSLGRIEREKDRKNEMSRAEHRTAEKAAWRRLAKLEKPLKEVHGLKRRNLLALASLLDDIAVMRSTRMADLTRFKEIFKKKSYFKSLIPLADPFWWKILALSYRDWFSRLWTYQEILLSRKATAMCGLDTVDFNTLRHFRDNLLQVQYIGVVFPIKFVPRN